MPLIPSLKPYLFGASGGLVGIGLFWILWSQPRWLLSQYATANPGAVFFVKTEEPVVALTIDDGPTARGTPEILGVLAENQARATFFLISDRVEAHRALTAEIVQQGHEIGNHLTKDEPSIRLTPAAFKAQLLAAHHQLSEFAPVTWLRPASGWYTLQMIETARQHHYQVVLGSVFPYDTHLPSVRFATRFILANVRPGSIIVLHDGAGRGERTAKVLAAVLPVLKQRGYRVVGISEMVK